MNVAAERAILLAIAYEWTHLDDIYRPWGVWIHRHAPLPPDASELVTPVNAVWFLDEHGPPSSIPPTDLNPMRVGPSVQNTGIDPVETGACDARVRDAAGGVTSL